MTRLLRATSQAKQDLKDIWRSFAEFSGLAIADDRLETIKNKFQLLLQFPNAGRSRDEILPGMRSFPAHGFVIFYRITPTHIEIDRVINAHRDIDSIFDAPEEDN